MKDYTRRELRDLARDPNADPLDRIAAADVLESLYRLDVRVALRTEATHLVTTGDETRHVLGPAADAASQNGTVRA